MFFLWSLWCHRMETFSTLRAICAGNSPVTSEFPPQRPVARNFNVFFDLRPNERLSKQSWVWWFEMPSCPWGPHCNVLSFTNVFIYTYIFPTMSWIWQETQSPISYDQGRFSRKCYLVNLTQEAAIFYSLGFRYFLNHANVRLTYIPGMNSVSTVPADALVAIGAKPSAGTMIYVIYIMCMVICGL